MASDSFIRDFISLSDSAVMLASLPSSTLPSSLQLRLLLPASFLPLLSRPLCPLCLCGESLLPSAFRPHRVPGVASVCTLYRKYGGCRRSCPALKAGKRFTCDEVM